ncbi:Hypothetical predicted protein, partial [Paramuricea clavata]
TSEHKSSEGELSKINLLADTSPELRATEKLQEKSSEVKILGLNWNTERDCFSFDVNNKPWRQYVQHRVNEIRRLSAKEKWRFCPGELNPADIPSRGCAVKELVNNKSWWNGPEFLKENPESWPKSATTNTNELADKELLKHPPVVTSSLPCVSKNVSRVANLENIIDIERYSTNLLRVDCNCDEIREITETKGECSYKAFNRGRIEDGRN